MLVVWSLSIFLYTQILVNLVVHASPPTPPATHLHGVDLFLKCNTRFCAWLDQSDILHARQWSMDLLIHDGYLD
eukprot:COSAG02_NODE_4673_length_5107_cov_2.513578_6_plen_74_part_00